MRPRRGWAAGTALLVPLQPRPREGTCREEPICPAPAPGLGSGPPLVPPGNR